MSWDDGHAALLAALGAYEKMGDKLRDADAQLARIDELQRENDALRAELDAARALNAAQRHTIEEYKSDKKYAALHRNWTDLKQANATHVEKLRRRNEQLQGWKTHADELRKQLAVLEAVAQPTAARTDPADELTQSSPSQRTQIKPEPDSSPVVVTTRTVRVKSESSLIECFEVEEDSIDLDEIGDKVRTPRKRRRERALQPRRANSRIHHVTEDGETDTGKRSKVGTKLAGLLQTPHLRDRPLDQLSLSDFKINRHANHGVEYAFTDVVRGKDARRCLRGCTRPSCCGATFRRVAQFTRATRADNASEDDAMLQAFLGSRADAILAACTPSERAELLLQAHTQKLADAHGRHRHAFDRRPSPPGFWRADFPTADEQQEDRREAERVEREMIESRYREAMKHGVWMFRDEEAQVRK